MAKGAKKAAEITLAEIGGIKTAKLNEVCIDAAIKKLGLQISSSGGPPLVRKVGALLSYFETRSPEELLPACDNCGGVSTSATDVCPFCGIGDEPNVEPEEAEPEEEAADESTSLALVPSTIEGKIEAPAVELDAAVQEILVLQRGHAASAWLLAKKVSEVSKDQLWKQRRDDEGNPKYRTFEQFAQAELNMSRKHATDLLRLFVSFSEEDFRLHGPTKLRLVLAAPEERQAEVLEKLKGGAGRREIERDVLGREGHDSKGAKGSKSKVAKSEKGAQITVATILGRKTIQAFAKPDGKSKENVPAKKISDVPWGFMDMANDVRMYITFLQKPGGELVFRIDIKRIEE